MIPFFSVCVVVRDRPVFLVQAVRSVLANKTWMSLIDRYGPPPRTGRRAAVKAVRAGWELGKCLVRVGG